MARKNPKPFDKVMTARTTLELYVQYGDVALRGQTMPEFAADLLEAFQYLMTFRNMVNAMASLDEEPELAALAYIPENLFPEREAD